MTNLKTAIWTVLLAFTLSASSSFTYAQSSSSYTTAQQPVSIKMGVVVQVREASLEASQTAKAVGGLLGGAIGALLGAKVSSQGTSNGYLLAAALGSLGATGGAIAADKFSATTAQEIVVRLDDGSMIAVAQSLADGVSFKANQKVFYMNGRIAPLYN